MSHAGWKRLAALLAVVAAVRMLVAVAWQCDDAWITHRTAWNLVNGHGLTWNAGERVQAFTHPLWLGVSALAHLLVGEVFFSLLVVSGLMLLGALAWLVVRARQPAVGWGVAALLSATASFVDWGVSGLENPLTFVLLLGGVSLAGAPAGHGRTARLGLLVSLSYLTRPDAPLFVAPLVLHAWWTTPGRLRGAAALALGALPLVAWEIFSLVWFGALVPNTALAKLNVRVPRSDLVDQGLYYLLDALQRDPLSLLLALGGATSAFVRGSQPLRALAVGLLAWLAYVVWIGGDFMSLRFVAAPAVLGAALLVRTAPTLTLRQGAPLALATLAVGLSSPASRWLDDGRYGDDWTLPERLRPRGLADERAFYAPRTRALHVLQNWDAIAARDLPVPPYSRSIEGADVALAGYAVATVDQAGYFAYFSGPTVYVVDRLALADPFLARIPFVPNGGWRVGHFERVLPAGYDKVALRGAGTLGDPAVDAAFRAVVLTTRGPLWAPERWAAIWELHSGVHAPAFASLASGVDPGPWPR